MQLTWWNQPKQQP